MGRVREQSGEGYRVGTGLWGGYRLLLLPPQASLGVAAHQGSSKQIVTSWNLELGSQILQNFFFFPLLVEYISEAMLE